MRYEATDFDYRREFCNVMIYDNKNDDYTFKKYYYDEDMDADDFNQWILDDIQEMNNK